MSYKEWILNFDNMEICNLTPDGTISDIKVKDLESIRVLSNIFSMWQCTTFHGKWEKGVTAGGRFEEKEGNRYLENPQYRFEITDLDVTKGDKCWVIVGLLQKNTYQKRIKLKTECVIVISCLLLLLP